MSSETEGTSITADSGLHLECAAGNTDARRELAVLLSREGAGPHAINDETHNQEEEIGRLQCVRFGTAS